MYTSLVDSLHNSILVTLPNFILFLKKIGYTDADIWLFTNYWLLWWLTPYIDECMKENNIIEINSIFSIIYKYYQSNDPEVLELLWAWFLENFNTLPINILPKIVSILPREMYDDFMLHYSQYLLKDIKT